MKKDLALSEETRKRLYGQLVKLGDMIGEGLHLEPDGKWISKEYRSVAKALGYPVTQRRNNSKAINEAMEKAVAQFQCGKCGSTLKQTRSGSKRAKCTSCDAKWQLLK